MEYTGSKYEIKWLQLNNVAFSCDCRLFAATSEEDNLQATTFVTLMVTPQKNIVMGKKIPHKTSVDPLLFPKSALLRCKFHLREKNLPPIHYPRLRHDAEWATKK